MTRRETIITLLLATAVGFFVHPLSAQTIQPVKIAFLNAHNLYDTINDPMVADGDYTPQGRLKWSSVLYNQKIKLLSQKLQELNPDIIGLCEVENHGVLEDLVKASNRNYHIIHYESCDPRGIDVALLYRPERLTVVESEPLNFQTTPKTREPLYAKIQTPTDQVLHLIVAHLPSKRGGIKADTLRQTVIQGLEEIVADKLDDKVVILGDMNRSPIVIPGMVNLAKPVCEQGLGTYYYRGLWNMFDQALVTMPLVNKAGRLHIDTPPPTIERRSSYSSDNVSDHLPIYFLLEL